MSKILNTLSDPELAELLLAGNVGVLPSDTVYGLAAAAANTDAVARLYQLKKRENKPGTIIAASTDQLIQLGIKAKYLKPVEHYWPGAISIVIPSHDLAYIHLGKGGIALRIPSDEKTRKLLEKTGPLVTSSANHPGDKPADTIQEAQMYFGEDVDFYVEGGDLSGRESSTVIRIVDDMVEVLREGAVKINEAGEIIS